MCSVARLMDLAKHHLALCDKTKMQSSAKICYDEASAMFWNLWMADGNKEIPKHAIPLVIKSLAYSIGKFHPDYRLANKICENLKA
jgi:hypothetical protein